MSIKKEDWDNILRDLLLSNVIFAPVEDEYGQDYESLHQGNIELIKYNKPKPATPLKNFFLPVKENVTSSGDFCKRIIIGAPNCDTAALALLDEIYLADGFEDSVYRGHRESTVIISFDCQSIMEHCHCLSYGIKPYSENNADIGLYYTGEDIIIRIISQKGEELVSSFTQATEVTDSSSIIFIEEDHKLIENMLFSASGSLPDYKDTGRLVSGAGEEIWRRYASQCVTCGACTTICPTCSCFLLIDKPGFEKLKQTDTCQYPGFARVAGGEDPLHSLEERFRNRYMCKYVWKPVRFQAQACTGCGRCIEACIGKINKNELFMELAHH